MRLTQRGYIENVNQLKIVNIVGICQTQKGEIQIMSSLMMRKVHPINPENSMKVQINTTPKT